MVEKPASDPLAELSAGEVRVMPPDYALKKIIGDDVDVKQLLSAETLETAQAVIDENKEKFLEWVMQDIGQLNESYAKAVQNPADTEAEMRKIARIAFIIKSQAGTFGFAFATRIAKSLDDFCTRHKQPTRDQLTVVQKHIDALVVIFNKNITGDGGAMGKDLTENLTKLIDKFKDK